MGGCGEPDDGAVLFGVVRFEPGGERRVSETVITFCSAGAADRFARDQGWDDYQVTPLRFFVNTAPVRPPAGAASYLADVLARSHALPGGAR
jgi:hypothetical protein